MLLAIVAVLSLAVGAVASSAKPGSGSDDNTSSNSGSKGGKRSTVHTIPGNAVYPEGIALKGKTFFVSSTTDGTIFKGNTRQSALTAFAPGGADGRSTAVGLDVSKSRLFVAGGGTGKAWVLSTKDGSTLKVLDSAPNGAPTFINDVEVAGGFAYFTDSQRPIIFRAATSGTTVGDLEPWLDLTGTAFVQQAGFNANGITSFDEGKKLAIVQSNTGKLFTIRTSNKAVREIDLGSANVVNGDGLEAHGSRLYVVRNADNEVAVVKLRRNKSVGRIVDTIKSDLFAFPTTAARDGKRLLVVNSQFDKRPTDNPVLPFTVASVRLP
ncbi:MAG TPA: hypothetical protein VMY78_04485 [Solirubrobacteraceae bacterium]|nr:hypothetical protein [Solirubrobacteraceae bacterium]